MIDFAIHAALVASLFIISKEDLSTRQIPDEASLFICILAVGSGGFDLWRVDLALALLILTGLVMGFGDAKLFGALALLLGMRVLSVLAVSFILAGLFCIAALALKQISRSDTIPFAPFILLASIINICVSYL